MKKLMVGISAFLLTFGVVCLTPGPGPRARPVAQLISTTGGVTESIWSGLQGGTLTVACPSVTTSSCPETVFAKQHTIVRFTYIVLVAPVGCTTNAIVGIRDVTSATNLLTSTVNQVSGAFVDSGPLSTTMVAGDTFTIGAVTAAVGCTTFPQLGSLAVVLQ